MKMAILSELKSDITLCNRCRCGFCKSRCPTYVAFHIESFSARGRNLLALSLLEECLPPSKTLADKFFYCTMCGFCVEICPLEVNTVKIVQKIREYFVEEGLYNSNINELHKNILKYSNPYGEGAKNKGAWSENIKFYKNGKILLFGGCVHSFQSPEILKVTSHILLEAGLKLNYLSNEPCCGYPLFSLGLQKEFEDVAKNNTNILLKAGVEEIIANCPACVETLRQYNEYVYKADFRVVHITEYLKELIDRGKIHISKNVPLEVTYHDPCHLTRYLKIFEEPREVIRSIPVVTLKEAPHNRLESLCCGGGGGMLVTNPKAVLLISDIRLRELEETGANTVITSCPTCEKTIKTTIKLRKAKMTCIDIVELVKKAMGG